MAKIYSFEKYKLRRKLRDLKDDLKLKKEYCDKNGYMWMDHYTMQQLCRDIFDLEEKIKREDNEELA